MLKFETISAVWIDEVMSDSYQTTEIHGSGNCVQDRNTEIDTY
jgi:hypothetical protein